VGFTADDDHRDRARERIGLEAPQHLVAVDVGHLHVQHNNRWLMDAGQLEAQQPSRSRDEFDICSARQGAFHEAAYAVVVVDVKHYVHCRHPRSHGAAAPLRVQE
jgi:hypothetical protein